MLGSAGPCRIRSSNQIPVVGVMTFDTADLPNREESLRKQRDAMSASIATRAERANQKMADRSAVEDEWDDAQRDLRRDAECALGSDERAQQVVAGGVRGVGTAAGEDDGPLVGAIGLQLVPEHAQAELGYWIAVDRAAQGTGCGSVLLAEVERRLEALHARMLVIETSSRSDYAPTRSFYMKRGYGEAARIRDFYAVADDRIIFTKRFPIAPRGAE